MANRLFERSELYRRPVADAVAIVKAKNRGDFVTYDELEHASGFKHGTKQWSHFIGLWKRDCIDNLGVTIWHFQNGDRQFKILTAEEQLNYSPTRRTRRARKQLGRAYQDVTAIDSSLLDPHQRQVQAFRKEVIASIADTISTKSKIYDELLKPKS